MKRYKRYNRLLTLLILAVAGCEASDSQKVGVLDDSNFQAGVAQGVVLVDFGASWCGPCRQQEPIVHDVARQLQGVASIYKLDVDQAPRTAQRFGIDSIPKLIIFKDGRPVAAFEGLTSAEQLLRAVRAQ